jgi:ATP synthase protein I
MRCFRELEKMRTKGGTQVTRTIAVIQLLITLLIAAVFLVADSVWAAASALVGGGVSTLVTLYFATQVFSVRIGAPIANIARSFLVGEAVKILLTILLFSIAILWLKVSPLPTLLAYMAALLGYWLALPFTFDTSVRTL